MIALALLMPLASGVKGGALLSDTTTADTRAEYRWYTLGPSIEFRLPRNFAVEFNPLYKRHRLHQQPPSGILGSFPFWPSTTLRALLRLRRLHRPPGLRRRRHAHWPCPD